MNLKEYMVVDKNGNMVKTKTPYHLDRMNLKEYMVVDKNGNMVKTKTPYHLDSWKQVKPDRARELQAALYMLGFVNGYHDDYGTYMHYPRHPVVFTYNDEEGWELHYELMTDTLKEISNENLSENTATDSR